jgi:ketosteroid isomerase-like protein
MKTVTLSLLFVIASLCASASSAQVSDTDEAFSVLEQAIATFNARDYAAYEQLVADDFEAYTGVYTPLRFEGKSDWVAFIRGLDAFASAVYEQRGPECRIYNGDTVLCNGYFVFTTVSKDGVAETQSGRESTTIVKINGKWLLANHHFSPLF